MVKTGEGEGRNNQVEVNERFPQCFSLEIIFEHKGQGVISLKFTPSPVSARNMTTGFSSVVFMELLALHAQFSACLLNW